MVQRYWEIDALRGIAILLMIFYHALFDIRLFTEVALPSGDFIWFWFPRFIASVFMLLVGISLALSFSRIKDRGKNEVRAKFLTRGAKIIAYGLIISLLTFLSFPQEFIFFGTLHFIGISIMLAIPFLGFKWKNVFFGAIVLLSGMLLNAFYLGFPLFVLGGKFPPGIYTFDFFPFLNWFWLILFGIFLGNALYPLGKRRFAVRELGQKFLVKQFSWLGRHSLLIYFLHQPILIAIILAFTLGP
ncbi:MAG: DUF1624 domain-containing protein [Candidatus Diapherotrites archaeon]|nr:DUF1624 domain-containing protein [Candidatus Diapherotrites archaeon]